MKTILLSGVCGLALMVSAAAFADEAENIQGQAQGQLGINEQGQGQGQLGINEQGQGQQLAGEVEAEADQDQQQGQLQGQSLNNDIVIDFGEDGPFGAEATVGNDGDAVAIDGDNNETAVGENAISESVFGPAASASGNGAAQAIEDSFNVTNSFNVDMMNKTELETAVVGTMVGNVQIGNSDGGNATSVSVPINVVEAEGGHSGALAGASNDNDNDGGDAGALGLAGSYAGGGDGGNAGALGLAGAGSGDANNAGGEGSEGGDTGDAGALQLSGASGGDGAGGDADAQQLVGASGGDAGPSGDAGAGATSNGGDAKAKGYASANAGSTGGAAGNTSASFGTGSIGDVSVSNVSGIVSMPMNTGINSNMVQSVSVNAQSNF